MAHFASKRFAYAGQFGILIGFVGVGIIIGALASIIPLLSKINFSDLQSGSEKMLEKAQEKTDDPFISYLKIPIEDIQFSASQFDVVLSSLAIHYLQNFEALCKKVYTYLKPGGSFVFSVEHPIFTSRHEQDWYNDEQGNRLHWPVDHYQTEGIRETTFLTENVIKYHRTLSTYMNDLIQVGFTIRAVKEPMPSEEMLQTIPGMQDELRRPMFLMIVAEKK